MQYTIFYRNKNANIMYGNAKKTRCSIKKKTYIKRKLKSLKCVFARDHIHPFTETQMNAHAAPGSLPCLKEEQDIDG